MASSETSALLELPNELLENIAAKTDWPTFKALRLTSREIAASLASLLARRRFQSLHYMIMDRHSLEILEQITAHPIFGKSIKVLTFNITQIVGEAPSEKQRRRAIWEVYNLRSQFGPTWASVAARRALPYTMPHIPVNERELRVMERAHKKAVDEAVDISISFTLSDAHVDLVTRIFQNLMLHSNTPKIFTHASRDLPIEQPRGWQRLTRLVGPRGVTSGLDIGLDKWPCLVLYSALCDSQYPLVDLKMGNANRSYVDNDYITMLDERSLCFQHLRSLKLALKVPLVYEGAVREGLSQDTTEHLERLHTRSLRRLHEWLCGAVNLDVFALKGTGGSKDFTDLLAIPLAEGAVPPLQKLRELTLCGQDIPKATLLAFIGKHSSTLELLDLQLVKDQGRIHPEIKEEINAAMGKVFKLELLNVYDV